MTQKPSMLADHPAQYLHVLKTIPLLTPQEEHVLATVIQTGTPQEAEKAVETLVLSNLKLAIRIARGFRYLGIDLEDLISEAHIGLFKAAQKFSPHRAKFSTYAAWWIKQRIRRYIDNHKQAVRVPNHMNERMSRVSRIKATLETESGKNVSAQQISELTGIPEKSIEQTLKTDLKTFSLEDRSFGEDSPNMLEMLPDSKTANPDQELQKTMETERISAALQKLNPRELIIINNRFGLNGQTPDTLENIGAQQGITRERVRQIQNQALKKLRSEYTKATVGNWSIPSMKKALQKELDKIQNSTPKSLMSEMGQKVDQAHEKKPQNSPIHK